MIAALGYWAGAARFVSDSAWLVLAAALGAVLLRVLWPGLGRVGPREAAVLLDRRAGLRDELLSASEFAAPPFQTPMEALQIGRARRVLESLPADVVAPRQSRGSLAVTLAMSGTGSILAILIATNVIRPVATDEVRKPGRDVPARLDESSVSGGSIDGKTNPAPARSTTDTDDGTSSPRDSDVRMPVRPLVHSSAQHARDAAAERSERARQLHEAPGVRQGAEGSGTGSGGNAEVTGRVADRSLLERLQDLLGLSRSDSQPVAGGSGPDSRSASAAAVHPHESVESATLRLAVGDVGESQGTAVAIDRGESAPQIRPDAAAGKTVADPAADDATRRTFSEASHANAAPGTGMSGNRSSGQQEAPAVLGTRTKPLAVGADRIRRESDDREDSPEAAGPYVATRRQSSGLEEKSGRRTDASDRESPAAGRNEGGAHREAVRRYFLDLNRRDAP